MEDRRLLEQLFSGGEESIAAWRQFLRKFSNLFLKIIWQFEKDRDEVMEKYVYVCSRLAKNDFAVLRKFSLEKDLRPSDFPSWMVAIVRNMCVDAHRKDEGRKRYPKALLNLDAFHQRVFSLYYWQGYSREEIHHQLDIRKNGRAAALDKALEKVERVLARMAPRGRAHDPLKSALPFDDNSLAAHENTATMIDPDIIEKWMDDLPIEQRAVVRMRFWEDMSASRIALLLKISPQHRVYTLLEKSLKELRKRAAKEFS